MNVSVGGLVVAVIFQLYGLWLVVLIPNFWRGDVHPRVGERLGEAGYNAAKTRLAVRGFPVIAIGTAVFAATLLALAFVNAKGAGAYVVIGLILVEFVVIIGLLTAIGLYNRPARLIPPMMRDGP